jgi:glycosyltransferase involved in cell wall biosynthesis
MFVRNGAGSIHRAIESVLAQTYRNIEFIVQDGASTDGTLELLAAYGGRLNVISEPDSGPSEGLLRAINRCTGDIVGSCLADEELLPDAVDRAVKALQREPDVGAITGDAIITNFDGVQTGFWKSGPFNLIDYLLCDYTPYFCSTFFRRRALIDAGLKSQEWSTDCVEFDLWCRLASCTRIEYQPEIFAKYASHANQSSSNQRDVAVHFAGRLKRIVAMCSAGGFFGESPVLRTLFVRGHARAFLNHAIFNNLPDVANDVHRLAREALAPFPPALLDGLPLDPNDDAPHNSVAEPVEPSIAVVQSTKRETIIRRLLSRHTSLTARVSGPAPAQRVPPLPPVPSPVDARLKARMYAELARRYEADGRLREALDLWNAAGALGDLGGLDRKIPPREQPGYTAI